MNTNYKKSNAVEKAAIEANAKAILENFLKYYLIFIDTCSILGREFDKFYENIRGHLENAKSQCETGGKEFQSPIIIPVRVIDELTEIANAGKQPELSCIATNRLRLLKSLSTKGLIRVFGDDNDNFADNVILSVFTKERIRHNLLLITEDKNLAADINQLNYSKAVRGKSVQVRRINTGGYLSQISFSEGNSDAQKNNRINGAKSGKDAFPRAGQTISLGEDPSVSVKCLPGEKMYVCTLRDGGVDHILRLGKVIASGGEGTLYETDLGYVAKIYHPGCITKRREEKVTAMVEKKLKYPGICFPVEAVYNSCMEFVGYLMPRAEGKELAKSVFIQPVLQKTFPDWKKKDVVRLTLTILEKIQCIHQNGMLIGDINPNNILVKSPTEVWFVDTDSYQVGPYPCPVGTVNFTAPEIQGRNFSEFLRSEGNENFAIATLVFMLMMLGKTPYARQGGGSQRENICSMVFPYPLEGKSIKKAPEGNWRYMWSHLPYELKAALYCTFMKGEKYAEESKRLGVSEWVTLISKYHYLLASGKLGANDPMSEELYPTRTKRSKNSQLVRCIDCGEPVNAGDIRAGLCPDCQKKVRKCNCRKCHEEFEVTGLERRELHRSYNYCKKCGDEVARRFLCVSCGKPYEITVGEWDYYDDIGSNLPIRCPECRKERKRVLRQKYSAGKNEKNFSEPA